MIFKRLGQGIIGIVLIAIAIAFIGLIAKITWLLFLIGFNAI